jgi:hypothetical protein
MTTKHVGCKNIETCMAAPDAKERRPGRQLEARAEIVDGDNTIDALDVL